MEFNLLDIISILHSFVAVILIIFLLTTKSQRSLSNLMLSLYFFVSIFDFSSQFLSIFVYNKHPVLGMLISETVYFLMPLFYLFVKSSVYLDFKITSKTLLHALPYFILNILYLPGYYIPILTGQTTDWVSLIFKTNLVSIIYISLHTQIFIYFFLIYKMLFRYKRILLENYSNTKLDNYKWLIQFVTVLFISDSLSTIKNIIRFNSDGQLYWISLNIVAVIALVVLVWLLFKALKKPEIFNGIFIDLQLVKNMINDRPDLKNENEIDSELQALIDKIQTYMKDNEPFLDPNLSMYDLARKLAVGTRELSVAINHGLKQHFFDFVNSYRVKKAMHLLRNPEDDKITVLEILYEVGFNSKSSFNTAFKKHTGLTPTEYKKKSSLSAA